MSIVEARMLGACPSSANEELHTLLNSLSVTGRQACKQREVALIGGAAKEERRLFLTCDLTQVLCLADHQTSRGLMLQRIGCTAAVCCNVCTTATAAPDSSGHGARKVRCRHEENVACVVMQESEEPVWEVKHRGAWVGSQVLVKSQTSTHQVQRPCV
jgi:hypothetical protein